MFWKEAAKRVAEAAAVAIVSALATWAVEEAKDRYNRRKEARRLMETPEPAESPEKPDNASAD